MGCGASLQEPPPQEDGSALQKAAVTADVEPEEPKERKKSLEGYCPPRVLKPERPVTPPLPSQDGNLTMGEVLAKGNFGSVSVAHWHLTLVAVKQIKPAAACRKPSLLDHTEYETKAQEENNKDAKPPEECIKAQEENNKDAKQATPSDEKSEENHNASAAKELLEENNNDGDEKKSVPGSEQGQVSPNREKPKRRLKGPEAEKKRLAEAASALRSEIAVLSSLRHPNVVQYLDQKGAEQEDKSVPLMLQMECCMHGSLASYIQHKAGTGIDQSLPIHVIALEAGEQIALALQFLHSEGWLHRDVRAANVFVAREPPCGTYKLGDFGLVRDEDEFFRPPTHATASQSGLSVSDSEQGDGEDPTEFPWPWTSPETFKSRVWTPATDCWSLGIVLWEIGSLCERRPYVSDFPDGRAALEQGELLPQPEDMPDNVWEQGILPCWKPAEEGRPKPRQIISALRQLRGVSQIVGGPTEFPRNLTDCSVTSLSSRRKMGARSLSLIDKGKSIELSDLHLGEEVTPRVRLGRWRMCSVVTKRCTLRERAVLQHLRHPHVVQYLAHAGNTVVLGRGEGGNLADYIKAYTASRATAARTGDSTEGTDGIVDGIERELAELARLDFTEGVAEEERVDVRPLNVVRALRCASQVAAALHFMHGIGVAHRAVRTSNVIVDPTGTHCRLAAFSRCDCPKQMVTLDELLLESSAEQPSQPQQEDDAWRFRAPETVNAPEADAATDVWGIGVIAWEVATGCAALPYGPPFYPDPEDGKKALRKGLNLPIPPAFDRWTWEEAVRSIFVKKEWRPSAGEALLSLNYAHDALMTGGLEICSHAWGAFEGLYILEPRRYGDKPFYRQHTDGDPAEAPCVWWSHKESCWQVSQLGEAAVLAGPFSKWPWQSMWSTEVVVIGHTREYIAGVLASDPPRLGLGGSAIMAADAALPPPEPDPRRNMQHMHRGWE
eukprot:Hpha_TRINITY_DN12019_c0_g2::TRINITY_DN12019_c0_g2_i1::g.141066::m.141066